MNTRKFCGIANSVTEYIMFGFVNIQGLKQLILVCILSHFAVFQLNIGVTNGESCNLTNDKGPQKNKTCIFPFTHQGVVYDKCGCILHFNNTHEQKCKNKRHPRAKFWCSTKVNDKGEHISGGDNYGFCDRKCMFRSIYRSKTSHLSPNNSSIAHSKSANFSSTSDKNHNSCSVKYWFI